MGLEGIMVTGGRLVKYFIYSSGPLDHQGSPTFRPLMHFEFTFVYGVRKCSNFILLHVAVQFSQHHLLKKLYFIRCIF